MAEYIINSKKYGKRIVLLDDEDYERVCTQFENNQNQKANTSGKVGVSYSKADKRYVAYIRVNGKQIRLGAFKTFEEAVKCRIQAEEKYFPNSKEVRFDR